VAIDRSKVGGFALLVSDQARRLRLADQALQEVGDIDQVLAEAYARLQLIRSRRVLRETLEWLDVDFPEEGVANGN
jgi:hypothetical protein